MNKELTIEKDGNGWLVSFELKKGVTLYAYDDHKRAALETLIFDLNELEKDLSNAEYIFSPDWDGVLEVLPELKQIVLREIEKNEYKN